MNTLISEFCLQFLTFSSYRLWRSPRRASITGMWCNGVKRRPRGKYSNKTDRQREKQGNHTE
jgi:hypothetical protein